MRFQTKLMLTMVLAIAVVTFAVLAVTEAKVTQAYTKQFSRDFENIVGQLDQSRADRSTEFLELCREMAVHPFIVASLEDRETKEQGVDFWKDYGDSLRRIEGEKPGPITEDLLKRFGRVGIMNREGEYSTLYPAQNRSSTLRRRIQKLDEDSAEQLRGLVHSQGQQTIYLPVDIPDRGVFVQEMVSTPVTHPDTGEWLGFFLRGGSAETDAQRFLDRFQQEFDTRQTLKTGIFLDGTLYAKAIKGDLADEMTSALSGAVASSSTRSGMQRLEAELAGAPYLLYFARLSEAEGFHPAYQVAAFPLAGLKSDLAELRLRGSGIGLLALCFAILIAALLSRNLATPLKELIRGTEAIQGGNLDHRVRVRSRDEIGQLANSFNEMADELKQKALYRELLGKVSDESVAQAMIEGELDPDLGGETKLVTVLFCDIRGFTEMTEYMPPAEIIEMLNEHMTAMTRVVREHYGVVDKFVGDEVMAVFGGLKSYGADAELASSCGLEMIAERKRLNRESGHEIEIGIGIATGEVVAGCMGSVDRLNYTVVGSRVNLASRLCGIAGPMEVIVDDATVEGIHSEPETDSLPGLRLKGFSETVTAYRLLKIGMPHPKRAELPA